MHASKLSEQQNIQLKLQQKSNKTAFKKGRHYQQYNL